MSASSFSLPHGVKLEQVQKYLDNRVKELATLTEVVAAKDKDALRTLAHRIKGNAALYGMPEFGLIAARLVDALDANDWDTVTKQADALIARLAEDRARFTN